MSLSGSKSPSESKKKISPKLPWWVEILFVQIGLPDRWLPKILRHKNQAQNYISDNRKFVFYLLLLFIGILYINPYTKYFRNQNTCIDTQRDIILSLKDNEPEINNDLITLEAVKICNGKN